MHLYTLRYEFRWWQEKSSIPIGDSFINTQNENIVIVERTIRWEFVFERRHAKFGFNVSTFAFTHSLTRTHIHTNDTLTGICLCVCVCVCARKYIGDYGTQTQIHRAHSYVTRFPLIPICFGVCQALQYCASNTVHIGNSHKQHDSNWIRVGEWDTKSLTLLRFHMYNTNIRFRWACH